MGLLCLRSCGDDELEGKPVLIAEGVAEKAP
jgi:hypothetical protein